MGLLTADNARDTAVAWLFVGGQFALLAAILVLPPGDTWPVPSWLDSAALAVEVLGAAVLLLAMVNLGRSLTPLPSPVPHGALTQRGLYRFVRHPIYTGIMALVVGATVRAASLYVALATAALVGWFMAKARWEEDRLADRYPGYAAYAARTPRFVPFWPVHGGRRTGPRVGTA